MSAQSQLEAYLREFRDRLKRLVVARGAAVLAVTALAVSLVAVYFGIRQAFAAELIVTARLLLLVVIIAAAAGMIYWPMKLLRRTRGVDEIERRGAAFDGRIETWDSVSRAPDKSPFLSLLAEDAMNVARRVPATFAVSRREINIPMAAAVVSVLAIVLVAAVGPDNWRYGMRHLWAGWLLDDTLPPQRVAVEPGDGAVRRGGDITVAGMAEGFDPTTMEVYALFDTASDWQSATMSEVSDGEFEFTFFAVREPIRYYVSAAGVRSQEYSIDVVDLPEVTGIRLTYEYPEWTGLEPEFEDPGADIRAVRDTRVRIEIETDEPLPTASLVVYEEPVEMRTNGNSATATITVREDGEYFIATLFNGDSVQLSDDYFITEVDDEEPAVKVVRPGRDWRASAIEEVTIGIEATDDFGLSNVELRYSVNGGEWTTLPVEVDGLAATDEAIIYLEDLRQPIRNRTPQSVGEIDFSQPLTLEELRALRRQLQEDNAAPDLDGVDEDVPPVPAERSLEPGDLISYYALAEDRGQSVQTDLFFIEVQPFDRRFTQGNAGGGGGGGGGGGPQDEISRRQKEILVATWNLIREQQEEEQSFLDEQAFEDNARMLAELQRTLAEQAQTLADRTKARQLTGSDERIARFVENLELAVEAMEPAAEQLTNLQLNEAVTPEQTALQYLLRAEAVFTDIQVSMQSGGGGGGGGLAGRDLSELFELEMDLERNQYETETPVDFDQQSGAAEQQQVDEAIQRLQELARRQEELARQAARRNQLTEQERWEQQSLRRETEELKRELERLQQQMQQARQNQQGQQGESGEQGQSGQQGQPGQPGQSGQPGQQAQAGGPGSLEQQTAETIEQLERALEAMNRAGAAGQNVDPAEARRAIEQARRQLDEALDQMTAERQQAVGEAYSDLAERASSLYADQLRSASALQNALEEAMNDRVAGDDSTRGRLDPDTARDLSEQRYDLQSGLEALEQDMQRVAQQFRSQTPGASEALNEGLADLQERQAGARLGIGGDYIRRGGAAQVAATDAVVTSALRDLERAAERAETLANREAVRGEVEDVDPNEELVAEIQSLRRQLAELSQGQNGQPGQNGQQGQSGEQGGQQPGSQQQGGQQAGGPQQGGQQAGGGAFGGQRFGARGGGFYDPVRDGVWDPLNTGVWQDQEAVEAMREQLGDAGSDLISLAARLRAAEGLTDEDLQAVRELGDRLRAGLRGNPELVEAEFRNLVNLAEQVELRLQAGQDQVDTAVRTEAPPPITEGFEDVVAEYYRRLSRAAE